MVTLWPQYYGSGVHGVLFCIDLSDPVSLAAAGLELHQLLAVRCMDVNDAYATTQADMMSLVMSDSSQ